MNHLEANELLAALSLDAVDEREREEIEAHVSECPKCRSELDGYMDVATALGNSVEPIPEGLWNSISSHIYDADDGSEPSPSIVTGIVPIEVAAFRRRRARISTKPLLATMGTVAAAIIVVLAVSLSDASSHVSNLQRQLASSNYIVTAALRVTLWSILRVRPSKTWRSSCCYRTDAAISSVRNFPRCRRIGRISCGD